MLVWHSRRLLLQQLGLSTQTFGAVIIYTSHQAPHCQPVRVPLLYKRVDSTHTRLNADVCARHSYHFREEGRPFA